MSSMNPFFLKCSTFFFNACGFKNPKQDKYIDTHVQTNTSRHIRVKLLKTKHKKKIIKGEKMKYDMGLDIYEISGYE